jgi:hypothetical protein
MSEDEARKVAGHEEEQDEVEAHRRLVSATDEPGDEARKEDDDDFEAHRRLTT